MTTTSSTTLEDLQPGLRVLGVIPEQSVEVIQVAWHGSSACTLTGRALPSLVGGVLIIELVNKTLAGRDA